MVGNLKSYPDIVKGIKNIIVTLYFCNLVTKTRKSRIINPEYRTPNIEFQHSSPLVNLDFKMWIAEFYHSPFTNLKTTHQCCIVVKVGGQAILNIKCEFSVTLQPIYTSLFIIRNEM